MATESRPAVQITEEWQDIVALDPAIDSIDVLLQSRDDDLVELVFGGVGKPSPEASRYTLDTRESFPANASNIWVRGKGILSVVIV